MIVSYAPAPSTNRRVSNDKSNVSYIAPITQGHLAKLEKIRKKQL